MKTAVTVYYLEMTDPAELRPARPALPELAVTRVEIPLPAFSLFLYSTVGERWHWHQRRTWTYAQWMTYLSQPGLETWVGYVAGTPAGYFELETQPGGNVEIAYFGLISEFIGRGLGGRLLTAAIQRGWAMGARRVWVHTCTLDHEHALANYKARGLRLYQETTHLADLPDVSPTFADQRPR
jgi:GNAT superfamily N-acetyltransferase